MNNGESAGASACAGGIEKACDKLIYPDYFFVVASLAVIIVIVLLILLFRLYKTKRKIKISRHLRNVSSVIVATIIIIIASFCIYVVATVETTGDKTWREAERCQQMPANNLCEF